MPKINELKRQELSYRLNSESFKDEVKNKIKWDWVAVVIALLIILTLIVRWLMAINIATKGYHPSINYYKDFLLAIENHELQRLDGDMNAIFGAMESPLESAIDFAASNGQLDELIQMAIEKKGKDAAWEFQSMNSSKGRMPRNDAGSARKKLNTIA
nr:hypothetical protein [Providencia stuartii]